MHDHYQLIRSGSNKFQFSSYTEVTMLLVSSVVYTSPLVITMKARFLPLSQVQTRFSLKSQLDAGVINHTCTFYIISKFNLHYVRVMKCRNRKCQQTQNTIHVVIFYPFVAFVFTYNSTATRIDFKIISPILHQGS